MSKVKQFLVFIITPAIPHGAFKMKVTFCVTAVYAPVLAKRVQVIAARPRKQPCSADVNDVKMPPALAALERVVLDGRRLVRHGPHGPNRIGVEIELVLELSSLQFGEGLAGARLKNRSEAVFSGHRFYDFHTSVAWIDLFAGSNHSGSL